MDQAQNLRNVIKVKNQSRKLDARVITVTSGKGGVGKSNVAVNLAVQISKLGKKVLIFDADFGLANVEVMFGAVPRYNLGDFLFQRKSMTEIITEGPMGIGFISGGAGVLCMNQLADEQIRYLICGLSELDQYADVILIDTGAGISNQVMEFVMASPEVLVVTTPEPSSLTDSYSLLKALYHNPLFSREQTDIRIVSNRVVSNEEGQQVYEKLNSVVEQFLDGSVNYLGMIPQDHMLERSVRQQKPVSLNAPMAKSARAFETMAANLILQEQKIPDKRLGIARMFSDFWWQKY